MNYQESLASLNNEGFRWEHFREYFPFGGITLGEGNYQRLVSAALEALVDGDERGLLLSLLDAQAAVFLEQVWVQNEQRTQRGDTGELPVDGHFAAAWLQINDNFRREYGIPPEPAGPACACHGVRCEKLYGSVTIAGATSAAPELAG